MKTVTLASCYSPFKVREGMVHLPERVLAMFGPILTEYRAHFEVLVQQCREWDTDYEYPFGNFVVQVDLNGLDPESLVNMSPIMLRQRIFEIENSIAGYQILSRLFNSQGTGMFGTGWCQALGHIRSQTGKRVVLVTVTEEKYHSVAQMEFGQDWSPGPQVVQQLSGFDDFLRPREIQEMINRDQDDTLFFVRASRPTSWLRDPSLPRERSLLDDPRSRRFLKRSAITYNVDDPEAPFKLNDTKAYLLPMGMGVHLRSEGDTLGLDSDKVWRAKPMVEAYGGYGHYVGKPTKVAALMRKYGSFLCRGDYVAQPEMVPPSVEIAGEGFTFIDRLFFRLYPTPQFIGGVRSFMPQRSMEGERKRNHGNTSTVWEEVVAG